MSQLYIALGFLISMAMLVVYLGARRLLERSLEMIRNNKNTDEILNVEDATGLPFVGSVSLFSIYILIRFIPMEYLNVIMSFYLSIIGIYCLGHFIKTYIRPNIITGIACFITGIFYFHTKNWMANNVLAIAIGVSAVQTVHMGSFYSSGLMLLGLFFYDIFWVFGSDVMMTVASAVDGPIKLLFPRTLFGDHESKSLLGLGDLVVPGFFIAQTLVFSSVVTKRGNFYFYVALIAYFMSLLNTMYVMIIFEHGQPALLFIVPWLLITFSAAAIYQGDVKAALEYTSDSLMEADSRKAENTETSEKCKSTDTEEISVFKMLSDATLEMFGFSGECASDSNQGISKKKN